MPKVYHSKVKKKAKKKTWKTASYDSLENVFLLHDNGPDHTASSAVELINSFKW